MFEGFIMILAFVTFMMTIYSKILSQFCWNKLVKGLTTEQLMRCHMSKVHEKSELLPNFRNKYIISEYNAFYFLVIYALHNELYCQESTRLTFKTHIWGIIFNGSCLLQYWLHLNLKLVMMMTVIQKNINHIFKVHKCIILIFCQLPWKRKIMKITTNFLSNYDKNM